MVGAVAGAVRRRHRSSCATRCGRSAGWPRPPRLRQGPRRARLQARGRHARCARPRAAFIVMRERIRARSASAPRCWPACRHDLRTPLTRMKLELAMLRRRPGGRRAQGRRRRDGADGRGLSRLRPRRGRARQPVPDRSRPAARRGRRRRRGATARIDRRCTPSGDARRAACGRNAFRRCLANLVGNARRYGRQVRVSAARRGNMVEIMVDDDGPGIPADRREEVFRPFFRLEGLAQPGDRRRRPRPDHRPRRGARPWRRHPARGVAARRPARPGPPAGLARS